MSRFWAAAASDSDSSSEASSASDESEVDRKVKWVMDDSESGMYFGANIYIYVCIYTFSFTLHNLHYLLNTE